MHRGVMEEAFFVGAGYQVIKLAVALLVHCQDSLVELLFGIWLCHVGFNAVDSLNPVLLCGFLQLYVGRSVAVLGDS